MVDSGDNFAADPRLPEQQRWQMEQKARAIAASQQSMGVDAMVPGLNDLALGRAFLLEVASAYKLPYVAANLRSVHGETVFPPFVVREAAGMRIAFIGLVPEDFAAEGFQVLDPVESLRTQLAQVRSQGAEVVVLLASAGVNRASAIVEAVPGVDFVIASGTGRTTTAPMVSGSTAILEAGKRGKTVGVLKLRPVDGGVGWAYSGAADQQASRLARAKTRLADVERRSEGARSDRERASYERQIAFYSQEIEKLTASETAAPEGANEFTNRFENLSSAIEDEPKVAELLSAAKETIEAGEPKGLGHPAEGVEITFEGKTGPALLAARAASGVHAQGGFAGAQACMGCHATQFAQWSSTPHAKAWQTLVEDKRSQDYQCFSCHVTGHGAEGGPESPAEVGYLMAVQCESCHGAGAAHVENPKAVHLESKVQEATCRGCHSLEQTGDRFNYQTYLPKVVHTNP